MIILPICGISFRSTLQDFDEWKRETGLTFISKVDATSGEIVGRINNNPDYITYMHESGFQCYHLKVYETRSLKNRITSGASYTLVVEGSLHKNYFGGSNLRRFTFTDLTEEVRNLANALKLDIHKCTMQKIEVGVNLQVDFNVNEYIDKCLLLHSTKKLVEYEPDKFSRILGRHTVDYTQKKIKVYNKGMQYNVHDRNIMRFEIKALAMQYLDGCLEKTYKHEGNLPLNHNIQDYRNNFQIRTLADLLNREKVNRCLGVLLKEWDEFLFWETDVTAPRHNEKSNWIDEKGKKLSRIKTGILVDGIKRSHWEQLYRDSYVTEVFGGGKKEKTHTQVRGTFNKHRVVFQNIVDINSKLRRHELCKNLIIQEFKMIMAQPSGISCLPATFVVRKKGTVLYCAPSGYSTIDCRGRNNEKKKQS